MILGFRRVSAQYFINEVQQKLSKPHNFNLTIVSFSSNVICRMHGTMANSSTKLLSPIVNFGRNLATSSSIAGQMPIDLRIHLLYFVT
ncbi:hypothetical protein QLX08_007764 [Tetragonisca angustula]|uniref:Uncharacterized protein n=1 Tax=Tetragonisca angustula TaxID=166442 RepID=A0AAW0ZNG5_9HYME